MDTASDTDSAREPDIAPNLDATVPPDTDTFVAFHSGILGAQYADACTNVDTIFHSQLTCEEVTKEMM